MLSLLTMVSAAASLQKKGRSLHYPDRIGRYRILLPIGSGGMATVFLGRATGPHGFSRDVAIKLTHEHLRSNEKFARSLYEEARIAARIHHRNVVQVTEVGNDPAGVYLVMDYVEGDTLSALSRASKKQGETLPARIGLRILIDALWGLHAAHEMRDESGNPMNLIHRDFSPQNILVGVDGVGLLTDFGIAKAASRFEHTATGVIKGKLAYMSPEQARGSKDLDRRSDVWSAGVIAWEILTGMKMYSGESEVSILLKLVNEQPPPVDVVDPDIPKVLAETVQSALTIDREQRCASAGDFAKRLTRAASSADMLADTPEVAEYVAKFFGPKLAERRRKIERVLAGEPQHPDLDVDSPQDPEDSSPGLDENFVRAASSSEPESQPDGALALPVARSDESSHSALRLRDITGTDTISVSSEPALPATPRGPSRASVLVAVAVAVVLGGAFVGIVVAVGVSTSPSPSMQSSAAAAPRPFTPRQAATEIRASQRSDPGADVSEAARSVAVRASSPIREIRVGSRTVEVSPPSSVVRLDLLASEASRSLNVTVLSADGHSIDLTLGPEDSGLEISFEASDNKQQGKAAGSGGHGAKVKFSGKRRVVTTRRKPQPRATKKKDDSSLAPNPYGGN